MAAWDLPQGREAPSGFTVPEGRISMPDYVDWHMILDQELAQLSRPEGGVLGALGFTALGAALGLAPNAYALWDKAPRDVTHSDLIAGALAAGSFATAVVCLIVFAIYNWRNRGLVASIRERKKSGFGFHAADGPPTA